MSSEAEIRAAAAAIANARGGRRGAPPIANVLDMLRAIGSPTSRPGAGMRSLYDEVMEDARLALDAAATVRRQKSEEWTRIASEPATDEEIASYKRHEGCDGSCLGCMEKFRLIARLEVAENALALIRAAAEAQLAALDEAAPLSRDAQAAAAVLDIRDMAVLAGGMK